MKKLFLLLLTFVLLLGCSGSKSDLYKETDKFVSALSTEYQSYGMLGGVKHAVTTNDGLYTVTPIGRLINVKIQKAVDSDEYESLRNDLENHYKKDSRVNSVYICRAGTVMIDCRN